ncbi:MAG TPA: hypothetical protein ENG45_01305 [Candidatus Aenigmarchaeota archaeon]|nr:hypothetical protein [Candidatus Aenigmarchaeota archaeon]
MKKRITRLRKELVEELESFQRELRKYLLTFITGSFSFVAALVWRDAIKSIIDRIFETAWILKKLPIKEAWFLQLVTAIFITIIAVLGIYTATKFLRPKEVK